MAQLSWVYHAQVNTQSLSTQLTHADGPVGICTGEVIIYSTHACRWPSWDMHKWSHYHASRYSTQGTHADGPVGIYTSEVIIYSTHACRWPSWDMHKWSHYLLNSRMQMAQLGYAQVKSLSTQLTHADGPVGIYTSEVIIYSTHACRWPSWDMHKWSHYLLNSRMQMAQLGYTQVKSLSTQLTHADGPVGIYTSEVIIYSTHACRWPSWICTSEVIIYSTHACRWPSWDMHKWSHYLLNSRMQMAQLGYRRSHKWDVIIYSTHACRWPSWDMHKWSHYLLNSRMQMAQLGYTQVKSLSTQLTHADGPVGICTSEVIIYSTHACRWPSWDMHKWSHYLLNSRMQMAQLGYTQVKSLSTQLTHADGPVGICTSEVIIYSTHACRWPSWRYYVHASEVIIYSTHACRWPSWDMHKWSHYLLNSRMQMAQLGYTQVKSLSTQLTHADGPVGIYTSEVIIYSTHACRWPSWDMHKWSHYLLNSRMQMAQLGYAQVKSLSTQLTHADGPVGIYTSEVIIYSTHACRWPSWDIHKWSHYLLNSRMQMAQLGYAQVKSLSTQLTHADGPVGICTSEVIIYSTHACRWPSWDIHKWSHYLLNSRMQMAQLGYAQEKSLSTQVTHAHGPVGIGTSEVIIYSTHACRWPSWDITSEVIIYSTHACRWPSWDIHKWSHYLLNSRMQMAQLGYAQVKSLSTQLTHAHGPVGICTSEVIIYSLRACRWTSWDIHKWGQYILNSPMQMAQLGYAQEKSLSTQLTHAHGPVGIGTSEVIIYSTHACRWPNWDIYKWSQYILNSRMQMAQMGYTQVKSIYTQLTHADGRGRIWTSEVIVYSTHACTWPSWDMSSEVIIYLTHACRWPRWDMHRRSHYVLKLRIQMAQLRYAQVKSLSTQLTHADGPIGIYTSEVNIYSTHACRWPRWDIHKWSQYILNSRMQMAQLGYAQEKSLSTQLTHAHGPVGIGTSEVIIYSTRAYRWPSWDIHKWGQYILNSRM